MRLQNVQVMIKILLNKQSDLGLQGLVLPFCQYLGLLHLCENRQDRCIAYSGDFGDLKFY